MNKVDAVSAAQLKSDLPVFHSGDTLAVHVKVIEGDKERIQVFQGVVINRKGSGSNATFTVRKIFGWCRCRKNFSTSFAEYC